MSLSAVSMPARAAPSESASARLEVDTSELGGVGPVLKDRLLERGSQVFLEQDISQGGPEAPVVRVTVHELEGEDPGFDYEIRLMANLRDQPASWSETCSLCTEAELIDSVASELDKVAVSLRALHEERLAETEQAEVEPVPEPRVEPESKPDEDRVLDTKGKAGIGVLAVGVVAVGAGIGLVLAPDRPLPSDPLKERYTQPPGYAALAVGGAAVITGAVLLGLSLRDRKRRMARAPGYFAVRWGATSPLR